MKKFLLFMGITIVFCLFAGMAFGYEYDFGNGGKFTYTGVSSIDFYEESWLEFDGSGDYVDIPYSQDFNFSQQSFAIEFEYRLKENIAESQNIITHYGGGSVQRSWYILTSGLTMTFNIGHSNLGTNLSAISTTIPLNRWIHVVAGFNRTNQFIFINGSEVAVKSIATSNNTIFDSNLNLHIGKLDAGTAVLNGSVRNVRIYKTNMTIPRATTLYRETEIPQDDRNFRETRIPIANLHTVSDSDAFRNFIDYINQSGFTPITYKNYYDYRFNSNYSLPDKPIILSFDDGLNNTYNYSYPIMQNYSFVGVIAVITKQVGIGNKATWAELLEMKNAGWEITSHSYNHSYFIHLSEADNIFEYNQSWWDIYNNLEGYNATTFIYPYNDQNEGNRTICLNYYVGCTGSVTDSSSPFQYFIYKNTDMSKYGMRRIAISVSDTLSELIDMINPEDGKVLHLNLKENTGTTATDSSGNGNDGTITGATWNSSRYGVNFTVSCAYNSYCNSTSATCSKDISGTKFETIVNETYSLLLCRKQNDDPYPTSMATTITNYDMRYIEGTSLTIDCTGTGTHTITNLNDVGGNSGYYVIYHNNQKIGYSNNINYSLSGCSSWSFQTYSGIPYQGINAFLISNGVLVLLAVLLIVLISKFLTNDMDLSIHSIIMIIVSIIIIVGVIINFIYNLI